MYYTYMVDNIRNQLLRDLISIIAKSYIALALAFHGSNRKTNSCDLNIKEVEFAETKKTKLDNGRYEKSPQRRRAPRHFFVAK